MKRDNEKPKGKAMWTRLAAAAVTLMAGGGIYVLFRSRSIVFFRWLDQVGLGQGVDSLRDFSSNIKIENDFVLYTLPDMLWLISYMLVANALISKSETMRYLLWTLIVPSMVIVNELLQKFHLATGTYDSMDLLAYLTVIGTNLALYIYWRYHRK